MAPQKDFMRLRMEIQTDLNKLGDRKEEWVEKAVKAHGWSSQRWSWWST